MDIERKYLGIVRRTVIKGDQRFGFIFCPALQMQNYDSELFFHFSRIRQKNPEIRTTTILQFNLLYSQKHPGKLAAKNIDILPYSRLIKRTIECGVIYNKEVYEKAKEILSANYECLNEDDLKIAKSIAFENSFPEFKLKLWIDKLTDNFDFNEFRKFTFLLNAAELKRFKAYAKKYFEVKKNDLRVLNPSKLIDVKLNGAKIIETDWIDIGFHDGKIFFKDDEEVLHEVPLEESKTSFNLLVPYLQKKSLDKIYFEILCNNVISREGLETLKDAILVIHRKRLKKKYEDLIGRGYNPSEDSEFRELTNKELSEIFGKHEYIEYLQEFQSTAFDMRLIYYDDSYLFSIPFKTEQIAIVWESIDVNKATYIFKCNADQYMDVFNLIETYLKDDTIINKRSKLIGRGYDSTEIQSDLKFIKAIKHVDYSFEKWEVNLLKVLPELENIKKEKLPLTTAKRQPRPTASPVA